MVNIQLLESNSLFYILSSLCQDRLMRVFIAVNLPDGVKEELLKYKYDVPAKWTKKENIHITLSFLGYVSDERLESILRAVEGVCKKHSPFNRTDKFGFID